MTASIHRHFTKSTDYIYLLLCPYRLASRYIKPHSSIERDWLFYIALMRSAPAVILSRHPTAISIPTHQPFLVRILRWDSNHLTSLAIGKALDSSTREACSNLPWTPKSLMPPICCALLFPYVVTAHHSSPHVIIAAHSAQRVAQILISTRKVDCTSFQQSHHDYVTSARDLLPFTLSIPPWFNLVLSSIG